MKDLLDLTKCMFPALLEATNAARRSSAFPKQSTNQTYSTALPMQSVLTKDRCIPALFKYGNAPLLSAVSIPMNNQPQLHSTAAPDTSTERTKAQRSRGGNTLPSWYHPDFPSSDRYRDRERKKCICVCLSQNPFLS